MAQVPEFRGGNYRKISEAYAWGMKGQEAALEPDLPIIDPHHHLWDDGHRYYLLTELMQDINTSGHNIIATVFVETGIYPRAEGPVAEKPIGEVEFVNGIAAASASGRFGKTRACAGIVGHADLTLGAKVKPILEKLIAAGNGRLRGIRYCVPWDTGNAATFYRYSPPRYQLLEPTFRKGFACLQPLGLSFDAWLFHPQLPDVIDLLKAFPDTNVVLNHLGGVLGIKPHDNQREEIFKSWHANIRELAKFPNLTVKIGGLGMFYWGWDFHIHDMPPSSQQLADAWRPYVDAVLQAFGPSRCMMESNFPVDKQTATYGTTWNALKRLTQNYSAADKALLYRDTAARVYRLSV